MNATEALGLSLEAGKNWLLGMVGDLKGDDLVAGPAGEGSNHALWILGHLAVSEAGIVNGYVLGRDNPLADWNATYGMGSTPTSNAADYAPVEELIAKLDEVRQATLKVLGEMPDGALNEKSASDNPMFDTKGKCFAMMINHQAFHAGQVADIRRALGKKPLFA